MLYELPLLEATLPLKELFLRVNAFHWLDSGNCGQSGAYVLNELYLKYASRMIPKVFVYSTPYQINDKTRPWISAEREKFVQLMKKNTAFLREAFYFMDSPPSLNNHFLLLKEFSYYG